jgi:hypothetical protein
LFWLAGCWLVCGVESEEKDKDDDDGDDGKKKEKVGGETLVFILVRFCADFRNVMENKRTAISI